MKSSLESSNPGRNQKFSAVFAIRLDPRNLRKRRITGLSQPTQLSPECGRTLTAGIVRRLMFVPAEAIGRIRMTEDALYLPDSSAATASIILNVEPGE